MATYEQNMYNYLKRSGLGAKFDHAGVYCIRIDGRIVYIGKSQNMLLRMAQHKIAIQQKKECKYRILAEAQRTGHRVRFDVLYDASSFGQDAIKEEIGRMEGEFIRRYRPLLNTQIPHADDWHRFDVVQLDEGKLLQWVYSLPIDA